MLLVKNLLIQWETKEGNWTKDQLMKNLQNSIRNMGRKPKDHIFDEKTFQFGLRIGKKKPKVCGERKDLIKIRYYSVFSMVKLQIIKPPIQTSQHSLRQGDRFLAIYRLLALLKTKRTQIPSLSPHLTHSVVSFAGRSFFRFAGRLIVSFNLHLTWPKSSSSEKSCLHTFSGFRTFVHVTSELSFIHLR